MSIFLKHIWRNVKDKKLMSALIIFALAISGALLFVALSIGGILDNVAGNNFESATLVFILIFVVTVFMSVFVVYSSFKYIMALRIKTLGTFRSIGASKRNMRYILLLESLVYGLVSAIIAVAAGAVLLAVLSRQLSGGQAKLTINFVNILITILFCTVLAPACAWLPIKASEKFSVKEIILQTSRIAKRRFFIYLTTGLVLIVAGAVIISTDTLKYSTVSVVLALIFILAGLVMSAAPLIHYFLMMLSWIMHNSFAVKNLKDNKAYNNIAVLLVIAIAIVFMINGANALLVKATNESFKLYDHQVQVSGTDIIDGSVIDRIKALAKDTEDADGFYYKNGTVVENQISIINLYGMSMEKAGRFFNFTMSEPTTPLGMREIFISRDYLARQKLQVGDTIKLNTSEKFKIAGTINEMQNSGNVAIINEADFEAIFGVTYYTNVAIKTAAQNEFVAALTAELSDLSDSITIVTIDSMLAKVKSINADMFSVLSYIVVLATVAGIFGVLNNLLIAFNSQKREYALMCSIGMSQKRGSFITIAQSLIVGFAGGLFGLLGGLLLCAVIPSVMIVFEFPGYAVPLSPVAISLCMACSIIICAFASLISLAGNRRLNTIKTLKEEIL